jgi:hypothetical protein
MCALKYKGNATPCPTCEYRRPESGPGNELFDLVYRQAILCRDHNGQVRYEVIFQLMDKMSIPANWQTEIFEDMLEIERIAMNWRNVLIERAAPK